MEMLHPSTHAFEMTRKSEVNSWIIFQIVWKPSSLNKKMFHSPGRLNKQIDEINRKWWSNWSWFCGWTVWDVQVKARNQKGKIRNYCRIRDFILQPKIWYISFGNTSKLQVFNHRKHNSAKDKRVGFRKENRSC